MGFRVKILGLRGESSELDVQVWELRAKSSHPTSEWQVKKGIPMIYYNTIT